jgi:hypothetical protein
MTLFIRTELGSGTPHPAIDPHAPSLGKPIELVAALRIVFGGAVTMLVTYGIGQAVGATI